MARTNTTFDDFVAEQLKRPRFVREFDRAGVAIRAIDDLIRGIDAARIDLGITKAELARQVSTTPEAIRRLLTSPNANPTLATILQVLHAVGLGLSVVPQARPKSIVKRPASKHARHR